jgi:hypothetical protein
MLLRTLEIPDAQGQPINAALLCSFIANPSNQQFLVYSLNEKFADDLVKIYLAPLEGTGQERSMCNASSENVMIATQTLKRIIHDACSPQARQTDSSYTLQDLADTQILCTGAHRHHSLKVSEHWLMKLLAFPPDTQQNVEATTAHADDHLERQEDCSPVEHEPNHSQKIETNLKSLIASMTQHKETLLGRFVILDERMRELEQREEAIAARERSFVSREEELIAGMNALKRAEEQLNLLMADAGLR